MPCLQYHHRVLRLPVFDCGEGPGIITLQCSNRLREGRGVRGSLA